MLYTVVRREGGSYRPASKLAGCTDRRYGPASRLAGQHLLRTPVSSLEAALTPPPCTLCYTSRTLPPCTLCYTSQCTVLHLSVYGVTPPSVLCYTSLCTYCLCASRPTYYRPCASRPAYYRPCMARVHSARVHGACSQPVHRSWQVFIDFSSVHDAPVRSSSTVHAPWAYRPPGQVFIG